jgi:hypothetical protein
VPSLVGLPFTVKAIDAVSRPPLCLPVSARPGRNCSEQVRQ